MNTKKPDTLQIMQWMIATTAIMRVLEEKNETITYGELAKAIGMTPDGWKAYHRGQITRLLNSLAAVERKFTVTTPLPYKRIVNAATRKPGAGMYTHNKIINIAAA